MKTQDMMKTNKTTSSAVMTRWATRALLIGISLTTPAWAWAEYLPEEVEQRQVVSSTERLRSYLLHPEFVPSRLTLRRYSPRPAEDLVTLATDRQATLEVRQKAVKCLALYHDEDSARDALTALFKHLKPSDKLYPQVIVSYLELMGEPGAAQVAPLLASERAHVRQAAIIGLGRFGGQAGVDALRAARDLEHDAKTLELMDQYLP